LFFHARYKHSYIIHIELRQNLLINSDSKNGKNDCNGQSTAQAIGYITFPGERKIFMSQEGGVKGQAFINKRLVIGISCVQQQPFAFEVETFSLVRIREQQELMLRESQTDCLSGQSFLARKF